MLPMIALTQTLRRDGQFYLLALMVTGITGTRFSLLWIILFSSVFVFDNPIIYEKSIILIEITLKQGTNFKSSECFA